MVNAYIFETFLTENGVEKTGHRSFVWHLDGGEKALDEFEAQLGGPRKYMMS